MPSYTEMATKAMMKNSNFGRGASRQSIAKYITETSGKCSNAALRRVLSAGVASGLFTNGASKQRFIASKAAKDALKPKKK